MRAAAVQLQSTPDRDRNLETADRLTRAAAQAGAELVVLPGEVARARHAGADRSRPLSRSTAPSRSGRARSRASSASTSSPARSPRAGRRARHATRRVHVGPDGEVHATLPQDPHVRRRGRRARLPRVRARGAGRRDRHFRDRRAASTLGLTDLLRPALPRAVPDPRRPRGAQIDRRPGRVHARRRRATTGRSCCAPARSRTRRSSSPPTRSASTRPASAPAGAR